jgi:hypothetical protein
MLRQWGEGVGLSRRLVVKHCGGRGGGLVVVKAARVRREGWRTERRGRTVSDPLCLGWTCYVVAMTVSESLR